MSSVGHICRPWFTLTRISPCLMVATSVTAFGSGLGVYQNSISRDRGTGETRGPQPDIWCLTAWIARGRSGTPSHLTGRATGVLRAARPAGGEGPAASVLATRSGRTDLGVGRRQSRVRRVRVRQPDDTDDLVRSPGRHAVRRRALHRVGYGHLRPTGQLFHPERVVGRLHLDRDGRIDDHPGRRRHLHRAGGPGRELDLQRCRVRAAALHRLAGHTQHQHHRPSVFGICPRRFELLSDVRLRRRRRDLHDIEHSRHVRRRRNGRLPRRRRHVHTQRRCGGHHELRGRHGRRPVIRRQLTHSAVVHQDLGVGRQRELVRRLHVVAGGRTEQLRRRVHHR